MIIKPRDARLSKEFLRYFLDGSEEIAKTITGVAQPQITQKSLAPISIPVPSLQDQRRIVAVLDEAFAAIAIATANAEKNLLSARQLPSSALTKLDIAGGDAEPRRLGDLVTRLTNGYVGPTRNIYVDEGIPYLLARHVRDDVLTIDGRTHITSAFNSANKKSILAAGDVLLVQSGHIGHSAVVPPKHVGHNCHAMIVITPKPMLLGEYLSAYFNSTQGRSATARIRSGSTVPHLTCKEVRELMIPLPSVEAQRALVEMYKAIQRHAATLATLTEQKLGKLTTLTQSLLHRAFSGELTEREPLAA
jgi:type I restriction enzyme S subunit